MRRREHMWGVSFAALICALSAPVAAQTLVGDGTVTCGTTPYTVASGDTLSLIARRAYGDPQLYGFIAEANWDAIGGNPENISVGMPLTIPCVDASGKVLTAEEAAALAGSVQAAVMAEGPLTPEQLDALFGPVALFPDAVLSRRSRGRHLPARRREGRALHRRDRRHSRHGTGHAGAGAVRGTRACRSLPPPSPILSRA